MLKSMTGYGRGECPSKDACIVVEAKSVNHRHLDIFCRIPRRFSSQENQVRKAVSSRFSRGRFEVTIQSDSRTDESRGFELNLPLAREYYSILKELKEGLNPSGDISLGLLAGVKGIIMVKEMGPDLQEEEETALMEALNNALGSLETMRQTEGAHLYRDFLKKLDHVKRLIDDIRARSPKVLIYYRDRLAKRVKELSAVGDVDPQRLDQEIAFLAERSDITEELVRIASHMEQFGKVMNMNEPVGRKLDFLLQEINRETNTIGSKANDAEISQKVVEIKSELEKIREQVQNIE